MCGKFHTPLRMVCVRVIIYWQKCDFSLKHLYKYLILKKWGIYQKCLFWSRNGQKICYLPTRFARRGINEFSLFAKSWRLLHFGENLKGNSMLELSWQNSTSNQKLHKNWHISTIYHAQSAGLPFNIPSMYNLVLWNNFLIKKNY